MGKLFAQAGVRRKKFTDLPLGGVKVLRWAESEKLQYRDPEQESQVGELV
jgi:hypothetical protein